MMQLGFTIGRRMERLLKYFQVFFGRKKYLQDFTAKKITDSEPNLQGVEPTLNTEILYETFQSTLIS